MCIGNERWGAAGAVVDIGRREGNALGILDVKVRLDTWIILVVPTAIDLDVLKGRANCIRKEVSEERLKNTIIVRNGVL